MRVLDLRHIDVDAQIDTDLCIVGSGPAGLSIANEFANTTTNVLVLESGGLENETATSALYDIESVGDPRALLQDELRQRSFGGTSNIWTGRCAPFDVMDFEERSWVPYSGWPLTRQQLEPFLERAGVNLGLGPNCYNETLWSMFKVSRPLPPLDEQLLRPMFWQFSRSLHNPTEPIRFARDLIRSDSPNLKVLLHANVTHINTNPEGSHFESVDISTLENKRARVRAKALVLCCGGIENARLLLASNRTIPQGIGNRHDLVGRFLMDHITCVMGNFDLPDATGVRNRFGQYWLENARGRSIYLHGLALSQDVQRNEQLLNCHAYIEEYDVVDDDPWSAMRRMRSALASRSISEQGMRDAVLLLTKFAEVCRGLYRRRIQHRPPLTRVNRIELQCMLEQMPDPESRVVLSRTRTDALGMPLSELNWKMSEKEQETARRMNQLIVREFQRLRLPVPRPSPWLSEDKEWRSYFVERAHPSGSTRISADEKRGVLDPNCQVHGVEGLFVAGSSVFPTSGAANPTLMIVAMAVRLADWLKTDLMKASEPAQEQLVSPLRQPNRVSGDRHQPSSSRIKVGFVGAGRRISEIYLPILKCLSDKYEIVGFTTNSLDGSRRFESRTGIPSFTSALDLVDQQKPAFLISAVADRFNEVTLMKLLDLKVPILTETPLAWSVSRGHEIVRLAAANSVLIAVAEQFPFLPLEQFKKQLIDQGIFGHIYAACNDFNSYSYHGIAQLRRYLKGAPTCVRNLKYNFGSDPHVDSAMRATSIEWQSGSVSFNDGAMLFHSYSDHYAVSELGFPRSTRFYGKLGTMVDYEIRVFNRRSGEVESIPAIRCDNAAGNLESISAALPDIGTIAWKNPYSSYQFSDEQIAVATVLDGMSAACAGHSAPSYPAAEFLTDVEIVQAFWYSARRNGAQITLPLRERQQQALSATSPNYWKDAVSKVRRATKF